MNKFLLLILFFSTPAKADFSCYFSEKNTNYPPYHLTIDDKLVVRADSIHNKEYFSGVASMLGNQTYWTYTTLWAGRIFQVRHYAGAGASEGEVSFDNGTWQPCTAKIK